MVIFSVSQIESSLLQIKDFRCEFLERPSINEGDGCQLQGSEPVINDHSMIQNISWVDDVIRPLDRIYRFIAIDQIFHFFPDNLHEKFPSLRNISIQKSGLKEIKQKDISHYQFLQELDLSGNELTEIEAGLFDNSSYLKTVFLNDNQISFFGKVLLDRTRLERFDFNGNECIERTEIFNTHTEKKTKVLIKELEKVCHNRPTTSTLETSTKASTLATTTTTQSSTTSKVIPDILNKAINQKFEEIRKYLDDQNKKHLDEVEVLQRKVAELEESQKGYQQEDNEQNVMIECPDSAIKNFTDALVSHKLETKQEMMKLNSLVHSKIESQLKIIKTLSAMIESKLSQIFSEPGEIAENFDGRLADMNLTLTDMITSKHQLMQQSIEETQKNIKKNLLQPDQLILYIIIAFVIVTNTVILILYLRLKNKMSQQNLQARVESKVYEEVFNNDIAESGRVQNEFYRGIQANSLASMEDISNPMYWKKPKEEEENEYAEVAVTFNNL